MSTLNPYTPVAEKPKHQTTLQRSIEEQEKAATKATKAKKKSEEKTTTKDK